METIVTLGRRLIPLEDIALVEPFDPAAQTDFKTEKSYKGRVILLNRESLLTEASPQGFAAAHRFLMLPADDIAFNPAVSFKIERFVPTKDRKSGPMPKATFKQKRRRRAA